MIHTLLERQEDQGVKLRPEPLYHKVEGLTSRELIEAVSTQQEGNRPHAPRTASPPPGARCSSPGPRRSSASSRTRTSRSPSPLANSTPWARTAVLTQLRQRLTVLDERLETLRSLLAAAQERPVERIYMLAHEHRLRTLTAERDYVASLVYDIHTKALTWPSHR